MRCSVLTKTGAFSAHMVLKNRQEVFFLCRPHKLLESLGTGEVIGTAVEVTTYLRTSTAYRTQI